VDSRDRILVRDGRRHHRPTYSRAEFRIGLVVLAGLALVVGWVAWRGRNPDPALFSAGEDLLASAPRTGDAGYDAGGGMRAQPDRAGRTAAGPATAAADENAAAADRGPLPAGLAAPGWTEGRVSTFGPENLYEKIDGREGFYKSLGFRRLWFVSIPRADDPATVVDVELYDLGETGNALGAYAGERPQGGEPIVAADGLSHLDRNALVLARGPYYVRAIGSDESAAVRDELEHLRGALEAGLPGEPLPRAFGLFVGRMGFAPDRVTYMAENAFSFGFAKDVYAARLDDDTELFVADAGSGKDAVALANRFTEGFRGYGRAIEASAGVDWTEDRYIHTVAGAKGVGRWTVGVRGAPDRKAAETGLARIERAVLETAEE